MLRMVFTADDLCRVRVARGAHPTWELILSINSLQDPHLPLEYRGWRATLLTGARRAPARWRCLKAAAELVPAGNFPDFLTPALDETDVGAHFENILSQPKAALREDIVRTYARHRRVPRWARTVYADGSTRGVVHALREYSDLVLGPVRPVLERRVEADRARYMRPSSERRGRSAAGEPAPVDPVAQSGAGGGLSARAHHRTGRPGPGPGARALLLGRAGDVHRRGATADAGVPGGWARSG